MSTHLCLDCDSPGDGTCSMCHGSGFMAGAALAAADGFGEGSYCSACNGSGECQKCGGVGEIEVGGEG
jgi:hypothetical protein